MKKIFLLTLSIILGLLNSSQAQVMTSARGTEDMFIGPTAGFGNAWVGRVLPRRELKATGNVGVSFFYARGYNIGWGADLTVSAEGYRRSDVIPLEGVKLSTHSVTPVYLRLPVRMYYYFNSRRMVRPMVFAGPAIGYKVAEHSKSEFFSESGSTTSQRSNLFKSFDAGVNAGGGLNLRFTDRLWANVNLVYYHGLIDAIESDYRDNEIENLSVNAGLLFAIR